MCKKYEVTEEFKIHMGKKALPLKSEVNDNE